MNKKVWLLIALAIAFLSVSVVSAYAAIKDATRKKIYVDMVQYINDERYSFKGWVPVAEDGSYIVVLWNDDKSGCIQWHSRYPSEMWHVDYVDYEHSIYKLIDELNAETGSCVSASTGAAGVGCLATAIKKKKGVW